MTPMRSKVGIIQFILKLYNGDYKTKRWVEQEELRTLAKDQQRTNTELPSRVLANPSLS